MREPAEGVPDLGQIACSRNELTWNRKEEAGQSERNTPFLLSGNNTMVTDKMCCDAPTWKATVDREHIRSVHYDSEGSICLLLCCFQIPVVSSAVCDVVGLRTGVDIPSVGSRKESSSTPALFKCSGALSSLYDPMETEMLANELAKQGPWCKKRSKLCVVSSI